MPSPPTTTRERYVSGLRAAHRNVSETLGMPIGLRAVERATHDGTLPHFRVGRVFRYAESDLDDWAVSLKVGGPS